MQPVLRLDFQEEELGAGQTLGSFRLEDRLGEGGMGVVFKASRLQGGETVALKVLRAELGQDETYRRRFLHEARAASEVRHAALVPIVEAGEDRGRYFLATAFVDGKTAEARVREDGPFPLADLIRLATEIGAGLDALHGQGVIHRDLKASNILLERDGSAHLTDFGLAKGQAYTVLTKPGQVMGTIDYLAPEIIRGQPASAASDLYALACTLYECAAGTTPFTGSAFQVGLGHLSGEPPDPGADRDDWPPALSEALLQGLAKDPASRPPNADAYATALRAASGTPG